jgi:phosphate transport system protein
MARDLRSAIDELGKNLGEIAKLLARNTRLADEAFVHADLQKIEEVKSIHDVIEANSAQFEEDCMKVLALYQPVARDLRHIMTLFKIGIDLERMSSLSERIARKTQRVAAAASREAVPNQLKSYFRETADLMEKTAEVLANRDVDLAKSIIEQGSALYKLKRRIRQQFQEVMETHPTEADFYITLLGISRHLGRLSNLAAVICEEIVDYQQETAAS